MKNEIKLLINYIVVNLFTTTKFMQSYNDSLHNLIYNTDASHFENNEKTEVFLPKNRNEVIEIVENAVKENKKIACRA
ncbi:hypothetical protein J6V86_02900 [bacterium]|nr:hypothetical protein [bacterium]